MKFTLNWLKEHLETDADLDVISKRLTSLGLEVEAIEDLAAALAPFKSALVVSAEKHPDADKLQVCKVDTGQEVVQVVCGAPNARTGMKGVFASSGVTVPGTDLLLKPTKIRGVESNGMLVSEREMGLSDDHEGIIELPDDTPLGVPFTDILGLNDPVIEIGITPNRSDCLGVYGVARDLAAGGLGTLKDSAVAPAGGSYPSPISIWLDFPKGEEACTYFAGRYVRGVKNGPSPDWLQQRLRAIGLRPISTLVDITNLITFDRGRPLHVYDADKLTGDIGSRPGKKGEKIVALDGEEYEVDEKVCVIADQAGVLGIGGVIGGEPTGVTEATTNIFIESASFDPISIAMTGRRLGIESDARYRFERGIDPAFVDAGMELATKLVMDLCGGEPSEPVAAGVLPDVRPAIEFDPGYVKRLAGIDVPAKRASEILASLGFDVSGQDVLSVSIPTWRPDIEGAADLVEEVARINGYDNLPSTPLPKQPGVARAILTTSQRRVRAAQRALAARGFVEAVTWSFIERQQAGHFGAGNHPVLLENPISSEMDAMRPSILPGLITAAQRNADRGFGDQALFEVGPQYDGANPGEQSLMATGIRRGAAQGRHWSGGDRDVSVFDVKADVLAVLAALGGSTQSAQITDDAPNWYHPGRSGVVRLGPKNTLAYFGELHPRVIEALGAKGPLVGFEVFLLAPPAPKAKPTKTRPSLAASDFQAVDRDFAFVVDRGVTADKIIRAARGADKKLITDVSVFDVFEGKGMEDSQKSVAIAVQLQAMDRTLKDEEIDAVAAKIVAAVEKATGGALRG
jgi:phenylalanyl-tRNA synthetase beta chain